MTESRHPNRREMIAGSAAAALLARPTVALSQPGPLEVSVTDFGATGRASGDDTKAIQSAIRFVEGKGGGTVVIPGRFHCGNIVISGRNVRLTGRSGQLVDGRLTIKPQAQGIQVADLGLLETSGKRGTYLMDVAGRNCRFDNVELVKDPDAPGYQMYLRQSAAGCTFTGLRMRGSNGIMVAGQDHLFDGFELQSRMRPGVGGDDAFAIKGLEGVTRNITIRNGIVRGYSAIVSFGSEIGTKGAGGRRFGAVRDVLVENVTAERCSRLAFFKPGALVYDWRNGVVEAIVLRNLRLSDPNGERFEAAIRMMAARGATIRNVEATDIRITARAHDVGVVPTAAFHITLMDVGAPATIEDLRIQVEFTDPYDAAPHSAAPGFPVDHVVRIEKTNVDRGTMAGLVFDVAGKGTSFGGICVGAGMDDAVYVAKARLMNVATNPRSTIGGGGIWSASRLKLGDVQVESVKLPRFAGPAFKN